MHDVLALLYPWTKAMHVVSMTAWMAGLFYLPRLFVYHLERGNGEGEPSGSFRLMESRLLRVIMNPAMIATWSFGLLLLLTPGVVDWGRDLWIYPKLGAVGVLSWFHHWLAARRKDLADGRRPVSGRRMRLMNEIPTVCLVVIVIMVIVKPLQL